MMKTKFGIYKKIIEGRSAYFIAFQKTNYYRLNLFKEQKIILN